MKMRTDTAAPETGQAAKTAFEATIVTQTVPGATTTEEAKPARMCQGWRRKTAKNPFSDIREGAIYTLIIRW